MIRLIGAQVVLKDFTPSMDDSPPSLTISEKREILKVERSEEIWRSDSDTTLGSS